MSYSSPPRSAASATASATASFPVFGLAFAVLLVLKLAGMAGASWGLANLSWWWVFSPILIGWAFFLFIILLIGIGFLVAFLLDLKKDKKRRREAAERRNRNRF